MLRHNNHKKRGKCNYFKNIVRNNRLLNSFLEKINVNNFHIGSFDLVYSQYKVSVFLTAKSEDTKLFSLELNLQLTCHEWYMNMKFPATILKRLNASLTQEIWAIIDLSSNKWIPHTFKMYVNISKNKSNVTSYLLTIIILQYGSMQYVVITH